MPAITSAIGLAISHVRAEPMPLINAGRCAINPDIFDISEAMGDIAATTVRMVAAICICSGVSLPMYSSMFPIRPTTFSRTGVRASRAFAPASNKRPFACPLSLSKLSFTSLRLSTVSLERMMPKSSASLPYSFRALPPSSTIPAKLSADLPKIAIAAASRSVSLAIPPKASRVSYQMSEISRNEPSAFLVLTPSFASSLESLATAFFSFDADPVMSLMDTSTRSAAYWNF